MLGFNIGTTNVYNKTSFSERHGAEEREAAPGSR